jgi:hypothetical protein
MKKIALFVCTVLCVNVLMAQVQFVVGDLTYSVINSNEVEVVSCVDSVDAVNIPATVTYNDVTYTVTKITGRVNSAGCYIPTFYLKTRLAKVAIPETITTIGEEAFCFCEALESIDIPNSVVNLGERAFYRCTSLRDVNIGSGLTYISEQCFQFCQNLTQINLGGNIAEIRDYAFANNQIKDISLPKSIKFISSNILDYNEIDDSNKLVYARNEDGTVDKTVLMLYRRNQTDKVLELPEGITT